MGGRGQSTSKPRGSASGQAVHAARQHLHNTLHLQTEEDAREAAYGQVGVAWESVKYSRYQPQSDGDRIFSDTVSRRFLEEENKTAFYNGAKYRVLGKPASACYDYSAARIQRMAGYLKV